MAYQYQIIGIISFLKSLPGKLGGTISYMFANLFYSLFKAIALICDWIESICKVFCGLVKSTSVTDDLSWDPATIIMTNDTVQSIFTSLLILGIMILFITTFVAIIKTEFNDFKTGNSKTKVLGLTGKAIVNLVAVPICCVLGVMMANVLLRAVHEAINRGTNSSISTQVFVAVSYSANWARQDENYVTAHDRLGCNTMNVLNSKTYPGMSYADMIDSAFLNNLSFDISGKSFRATSKFGSLTTASDNNIVMYVPIDYFGSYNASSIGKEIRNNVTSFSIHNNSMVMAYYNILDINKLVGIVAIILVTYNMLMMVIGLIKRIFDIGMYYLVSPPLIALYPLDGGIIAIDMFLILLPVIMSMDFISPMNLNPSGFIQSDIILVINGFMKVLIVVAGTNFLKTTSVDITKMIAGKDADGGALASGAGAMGDIKKTLGKAFKIVMLAAKLFGGVAGGAINALISAKKVGGKAAFKNFANSVAKKTLDLGKGVVSNITNKKFKPGSNTPLTDAKNFFKTGTTNKERQQAILSLSKKQEENKKFVNEATAYKQKRDAKGRFTGTYEATNGTGRRLDKSIDKLEKKKAKNGSLSARDTKKLDSLNAERSRLQTLSNSAAKTGTANNKRLHEIQDSTKLPTSFFAKRSLDRATGGGENFENASGAGHDVSEAIHNATLNQRMGRYNRGDM